MKLPSSLLLGAALCFAPLASAQLLIHDFASFESPATTVFVGDWALNGDPVSGDAAPIATFAQGAGSYTFAGGSNADTAGAFYFYAATPGDLTGLNLLEISAQTLAGNTAATFTVSLFDSLGESAFAVFATADFAGAGFTTVAKALTYSAGFNRNDLASFLITGGVFGGTDALNLAVDNLVAIAPPAAGPVPEPSAYGAIAALALLGLAGLRRQRRSAS